MKRIRIFFQTLLAGVLFVAVFSIFWFVIGVLEELVVHACLVQPVQSLADLNWLGTFVMVFLIVITYRGAKDITFWMVRKLFPDLTLRVCVNYMKRISYTGQKAMRYIDLAVEKICKRDSKDHGEILESYGVTIKQAYDDTFEVDFGEQN